MMKARSVVSIPILLTFAHGADVPWGTPCESPIGWHIADVDERFGLSVDEVADAVRRAAMLWGEAIGNPLLFQETSDGLPIRLVFDERQEAMIERERRLQEIEEAAASIREGEADLLLKRAELEALRDAHQERSDDLRARLESHRSTVEYWHREGVAPSGVLTRLQDEGEALEIERALLNDDAHALNDLVEEVNAETRRLNDEIAAINEARLSLQEDFPLVAIRSGHYQESRRTMGPVTVSVEREIEVYRFSSLNNLVMVVAHELGHALGLGHSDVPDAVMSDTYVTHPDAPSPQLHESDIEAIRALCR